MEDAVRSAPSKLYLAGGNPKNDIVLESNRVGFTSFGEGVQILDPHTGKVRPSTKADVAATALMVDYLSDVDVYERAIGAPDVPQSFIRSGNARDGNDLHFWCDFYELLLGRDTRRCPVSDPRFFFEALHTVDIDAEDLGDSKLGLDASSPFGKGGDEANIQFLPDL